MATDSDPDETLTLGPLELPAPVVELPTPCFAERYQLGAELARGGLANIRAAHDVVLDRQVAVKQLRDRDPGLAVRFLREARLTSRLVHPSIVPIYDLGLDADGVPSYAMKWVEGQPLSKAIAACGSLDERLALIPAVVAIADAVAYAHSQRVIHRDLKPANVIIGAFGEVVVIDWGLALPFDQAEAPMAPRATPADPRLTSLGSVLGTPCYMPPEQARGDRVDLRADIYALGALLYQLVAMTAPYDQSGAHSAHTDDPVWKQVIAGPPRPIAVVEPAVPAELATIIDRAMARAPADRYPSASALATELTSFLTHQTSRRLAIAACDRVDELGATLARLDGTSAPAVAEIYRLADVARFGLDEALATWPTNPAAQHGLGRLRAALFDFELERDNLPAATALATELPGDRARQAALARRREVMGAQQAATAASVHARDQRVGLRERTVVYVSLLVLMVGMFIQTLVAGADLGHQPDPVTLRRNAAVALAVVVIASALGRRGIFGNAVSAAAGRMIITVIAALVASRTFGLHVGLPAATMMTLDLIMATAVMVTYGRLLAAAPLALAAAAAAIWPVTTRLAFNLSVFVCGLVLIAAWRREARAAAADAAR